MKVKTQFIDNLVIEYTEINLENKLYLVQVLEITEKGTIEKLTSQLVKLDLC